LGGRRVAVNHYDSIARAIAASGEFDVVWYGGGRTDVASTFMIYDTVTGEVAGYEVSGSGSFPREL
jgi:hypothetical protein